MSPIKNVALAGASGSLGSVVLKHLQASGDFNITILRRHGSQSTFAPSLKTIDVDYNSIEELTAALQGQDAVVATLTTMQVAGQRPLIEASVAAGVKRFIPSDFGSDLDNPTMRALPVYADKVAIQELLKQKAKAHELSYTLVYNSAFLDWGLQQDFLLKISDYKPVIYDGGDITISTTTVASVADAVVGILHHPDETANRAVYVEDIKVTQNKLLELAKKVAPEKPWAPEPGSIDKIVAKADERLKQGLFDVETFVPYLYRALFGKNSGANFEKTDNELLGIKGATEDDIVEILKTYIK